jgi:hypothetical protein
VNGKRQAELPYVLMVFRAPALRDARRTGSPTRSTCLPPALAATRGAAARNLVPAERTRQLGQRLLRRVARGPGVSST